MTSHPFHMPRFLAAGVLGIALLTAACDDPFAEFLINVPDTPEDAQLFDFESGLLQDPSAFDVVNNSVARPDLTTQWDFVFRVVAGQAQLYPFSALTDSLSEAGLVKSSEAFEEILKAPEDGYEQLTFLPVNVGDVFIARSRRDRTQFLICSQYLKLEVLEIDLQNGTLLFQYIRNPNCGDFVLEPGTHGSL